MALCPDPWQRRTRTVLLAVVNDAVVSALVNPIFVNPGASAATFELLAALVASCRAPAAEGAPRRRSDHAVRCSTTVIFLTARLPDVHLRVLAQTFPGREFFAS